MKKIIILTLLLLGFSYALLGREFSFQSKLKEPLQDQSAQTFDQQLLDHFDSSQPKIYWSQNYWIFDKFFDSKQGPLFLYLCGESQCFGITEGNGYTSDLAEKYNGIAISLEHRFYGSSQPFGYNNETFSTENLRYLSHYQALDDIAVFIQYLKDNEVAGITKDTPIITVGGSYPGALSAWFRYKYPHLTIGAYASSAVVNAIDNFVDFDKQFGITLDNYGDCKQTVKDINQYFVEQLSTPENNKKIKAKFNAQILDDDQFLEMVSNYPMAQAQFGDADNFCSLMKGKSMKTRVQILSFILSGNAYFFTVEAFQQTQYSILSMQRQWYHQLCTNFGWWQGPYPQDPIRPAPVNLQFFHKNCQLIFGDDYVTNAKLTDNLMGGTDMRINNIVFTNGSEDPWQQASITQNEGQMNSYISNCKGCGHCRDLQTPKEDDPESLKQVRQSVENHIDQWLDEYRQQLYDENEGNIQF